MMNLYEIERRVTVAVEKALTPLAELAGVVVGVAALVSPRVSAWVERKVAAQ